MACELARYGVAVRIIDKAAQRTDKSKALVLWSRTLELLDRSGGSAPFIDAGFKVGAVNILTGGEVVGHVDMGSVETPYPYALMLPQTDTERLLDETAGLLVGEGARAFAAAEPEPASPRNPPTAGSGDTVGCVGSRAAVGGEGERAATPWRPRPCACHRAP